MTTGSATGNSLTCRRCSFQNHPGDSYCERCSEPVVPPPSPSGGRPAEPEDGTTRYLCAAAQRDPVFGDTAIAEYLVERVRAIPPSPGVNSAAVLREAVAARARRRMRDAVLLLLLITFALLNPAMVIVWLLVALPALAVFGSGESSRRQLVGLAVAVGVLLFAVTVLLGLRTPEGLAFLAFFAANENPGPTLLLSLLMFGMLVTDEITVHYLVTERFRRNTFVPNHRRALSAWERTVRGLGHRAFQAELDRVAAATDQNNIHRDNQAADVIVHRGRSPFVGAGQTRLREVIALPLNPAEEESPDRTTGINVVELHQHVAATLAELRSASSLTPGKRLEGLLDREQVLMPADRLVTNHRMLPDVLTNLDLPPSQHMPPHIARKLAEHPLEWARYYRCYRIEAWDRDLTTSCYFFAGTDQRMLYLEWTHCVLPPIKEHYRAIDHPVGFGAGPLSNSVGGLLLLPATVLRRLMSVTHRFVPLKQRVGEVDPERYGAGRSLRELAADDEVQTYFQGADAIRYVKIIDTALFRAVGQFLEKRRYDVVEFQKIAKATITNNNVLVSGGTFIGSTMGAGTVTGGGTTQTGPAKGSE